MGRMPKPTQLKRLEGNPGKRALPKAGEEPEPRELIALGEPPDLLGDYGAQEWRRVGPVLIEAKLLTEGDLAAFTAYCMNLDVLIRAKLDIDENGMTIRGKNGDVRNPALATFSAASSAMLSYCVQFGMTPSSRSRIRLPGDDDIGLNDLIPEEEGEDAI